MKLLRTICLIGTLVGSLAVIGCGDDPPPAEATGGTGGNGNGGNGGDGGNGGECMDGDLCCIQVCVTNENFRTVCLDEYNDCVGMDGDPGQCRLAAEETCTL